MGAIRDTYDIIIDFLERIGLIKPKKKEVPLTIKNEIYNYGFIVQNEFKEINIISLKWDEDFIETKSGELYIKDNKLKINVNSTVQDVTASIDISKCAYPSLAKHLPHEAKVALQLYVNYKISLKNNKERFINYIEDGLKKLDKKYQDIVKWFNIFVKLDLIGNLEGIIVPLSKTIKEGDDNFTNFIINIYLNKKIKQPQKINGNLIGIIKVGKREKIIPDYVSYSNHLIEADCDIIIICGFGKWRNKVVQLSDILEQLYQMKKSIIVTKIFNDLKSLRKDKESTKGYFVHLSKSDNLDKKF